jgi:hypothetical protein
MLDSRTGLIASEAKNNVWVWAGGGAAALALLAIIAFVAGRPAKNVEGETVASVCRPSLEKIFSDQLSSVEDNDHHPILMVPYKRLDRVDVSGDYAFCSLGARAVDRPLPDSGPWYWRAVSFVKLRKKGEQWQITASHLCLPIPPGSDIVDDVCDQEDIKTVICDVNGDCPGVTSE